MIAGLRRIPELKPNLFDPDRPEAPARFAAEHAPGAHQPQHRPAEVLDALWDDPTISQQIIEQRRAAAVPERCGRRRSSSRRLDTASSGPAILAQALSAQSDYFTVTVTPADGPNEAFEALVRRTDAATQIVYVKRVSKEVAP